MQKNESRSPISDSRFPIPDHRSFERISLLLASFCLAISSGYLSGRLISDHRFPITIVPDPRPPVPVVFIEGVRNGLLYGKITGTARVAIGNEVLTQSGVFALDAGKLLVNEVSVNIPAWAQFVASKNGKKYYKVNSASGRGITPKNRVFFRDVEEAKSAGYSQ